MNRTLTKFFSGALFLCLLFAVTTAKAQREVRTLNDGWEFRLGEVDSTADASASDVGDWQPVHLPHTWNTDAYVSKDYFRGTGWYRRTLRLPQEWRGRHIVLKCDAASKAAALFVNGREVGEHAGGYTAFAFDITPYLDFDVDNTLLFRVDNAREDIPPVSGDFTFFGGIYRDVWLLTLAPCHFEGEYASDGVNVSTPRVSAESGTVAVRSRIKNDASETAELELCTSLYDPDGAWIQTFRKKVRLQGGGVSDVRFESAPVPHPQLWTPETPRLYRVETVLKERRSGRTLDRTNHAVGFRWFRFDAREGFFLNGRPYKLRGICRHQDQKPLGPALTDEMHRRDFRLMKEMGANFIRISHYPQDDALLEMCDREGMLVWEEIPVIDIVPDTPDYGDNCERNLREMIRQHVNHPSVILWGYMNEILLVTQRRYPTPEEQRPVVERTLRLAQRLERALKEEDDTRVSTMAFHGSDAYNETGLSAITDVVGWNLYQGWYGGDLSGFDRYLEKQQHDWPDHPLLVSEYGAGSDRRLHAFAPRPFDFSIEYQQRYVEHYLPVLERTPYVCGGTYWNFIDFSSALRDESMPRINNKGLVYADRTPKDVYYYYKAAWRADIPVLHIACRDWPARAGIRREGEPVVQPVKIYTNLPEVELFIDGRSLGIRPVENFHAVFEVPFRDGEPCLSARGVWHGEEVHDGLCIRFASVPDRTAAGLDATELAVNVGSDCFFTSAESGLAWVPDRPYESGGWGYLGGEERSTQTEIALTTDGPLFQTQRSELTGYRFDVPSGDYEVELLFADIDRPTETAAYLLGKGGDSAASGVGNRFAIRINGATVESDCAPARDNGCFRALRKRYTVHVDDDRLQVDLKPVQGRTFLSGIKIRKL